jgi:hypothetical protein
MKIVYQQGSALIVSLVMLTSVTFLAILSLQGSTTQLRVVGNLQIKEDVFHTSKRELGSQYDSYRNELTKVQELSLAMEGAVKENADGAPTPEAISLDSMLDTTTEPYTQLSQLRYTQRIPVNLNYSFAKDSSVGAISSMPFEIVSVTTDKSERFHSNQRLGFKYNVPSAGR